MKRPRSASPIVANGSKEAVDNVAESVLKRWRKLESEVVCQITAVQRLPTFGKYLWRPPLEQAIQRISELVEFSTANMRLLEEAKALDAGRHALMISQLVCDPPGPAAQRHVGPMHRSLMQIAHFNRTWELEPVFFQALHPVFAVVVAAESLELFNPGARSRRRVLSRGPAFRRLGRRRGRARTAYSVC